MLKAVESTWTACRRFVGEVCAGRPSTHGLSHMESVTETSIAIAALEGFTAAEAVDVVVVAMLHDVNDHKYDPDNTLGETIRGFLADTLKLPEDDVSQALAAIGACSFSKEKKQGMRYFEKFLAPRWVRVRDIVSDADKLHAIGYDGLLRCWEFGIEIWNVNRDGPVTHEKALHHVVVHADEKLLRLASEFIVTPSGKMLAARKQAEMVSTLHEWQRSLPTHLPLRAL